MNLNEQEQREQWHRSLNCELMIIVPQLDGLLLKSLFDGSERFFVNLRLAQGDSKNGKALEFSMVRYPRAFEKHLKQLLKMFDLT
ncbi:MAG: hypothetical protein PVJ20_02995 [Desulfobacterales bacterium]|jgi:hypothetical protein